MPEYQDNLLLTNQKKQIQELKALQNDFRELFLSEKGKRVLEHLKKVCGYDGDLFANDPYRMAWNLGVRSVYLHIKTMIEMDFEEIEKERENVSL